MKKIIMIAIVSFLLMAGSAAAVNSITFKWQKNTETDLAGYKMYRAATPDGQVVGLDTPVAIIPPNNEIYDHNLIPDLASDKEALTIDGVEDGTWYWILTAYDFSDNETGKSNEVSATLDSVPPAIPVILEIIAVVKAP
jgi:hypothetical protein